MDCKQFSQSIAFFLKFTGEYMHSTSASKKELAFTTGLGLGSKGAAVRKIQEWLSLQGHGVLIDGDFGPATLQALKSFQAAKGIKPSSSVGAQTWGALVQPMHSALADLPVVHATVSSASLAVSKMHLAVHPTEAGGDNCGPWVRLYTGGRDGIEWRWCAGFVTFVLNQACKSIAMSTPIKGSLSCDSLALQAKSSSRFVSGKSLVSGAAKVAALGDCSVFLVRRVSGDWTHTGFAFNFTTETFETIEGNTNDDGNANGYEVCRRTRKISDSYDFIKLD
jgi:peptidoglycan hydrolase-like protein with peptidoglycan-binding domain